MNAAAGISPASARIIGFLLVLIPLVAATPVRAHQEDEGATGDAYILVGDLVPEEAVPGPGPDPAGAFPELTVDPGAGTLCYDMFWDQFDPVTGLTIRLGYPDTFDAIEIDFASTPPDEFGEEGTLSGYAIGCVENDPAQLEFLVNEPHFSHITVYSDDYPQGAAGGPLFLVSGPGIEQEEHEEPPEEITTTVLVAQITPEQVVPDPPDVAGSGDARLEVTPLFDEVCWEIRWDLDDAVTSIHLHPGGIDQVDAEEFRLDFIQEARTFGGTVRSDFTDGCISVTHVVDFFALVENPEGHYVDVHTEIHPEGALRGQLVQAEEFDTAFDEFFDHHLPEESGRSPVDYILHLLSLLALVGVTVFGIFTIRRARELYEQPSTASVAVAATAYALLAVTVVIMLLDRVLAPSGPNVVCSDYDRFSTLGLMITLGALIAAAVAVVLAAAHPPLRQVSIAMVLVALVVAVAWILWVSPEGCVTHGDVEPHIDTTIPVEGDSFACEERVSMHGDPIPEFEGYATPEEAVANNAVAALGEAKHEGGNAWLVELDGRIVARFTVDPWKEDRYIITDNEVCLDVEHLLDF